MGSLQRTRRKNNSQVRYRSARKNLLHFNLQQRRVWFRAFLSDAQREPPTSFIHFLTHAKMHASSLVTSSSTSPTFVVFFSSIVVRQACFLSLLLTDSRVQLFDIIKGRRALRDDVTRRDHATGQKPKTPWTSIYTFGKHPFSYH